MWTQRVVRLIRAIRGKNHPLQNHSTSLMPTRRVGLQQPISPLFSSAPPRRCASHSISVSLTYKTHLAKRDLPELAFEVR